MARAIVGLVAFAAVFAAGFVTGRISGTASDEADGVAGDVPAVQPGSQDDPIPLGETSAVGPWLVRVLDYDEDAVDAVLAANQFNVEPAAGRTYVTVEVALTRRGPGPGVVRGSLVPELVTPADRGFPLTSACGVVVAALDAGRLVAPDEQVVGQWCWDLPLAEVDKVSLRMGGTGGGAVHFALR